MKQPNEEAMRLMNEVADGIAELQGVQAQMTASYDKEIAALRRGDFAGAVEENARATALADKGSMIAEISSIKMRSVRRADKAFFEEQHVTYERNRARAMVAELDADGCRKLLVEHKAACPLDTGCETVPIIESRIAELAEQQVH